MILVVANVEAKPNEAEQLIERFNEYAAIVRENEPGVLFFEIYAKPGHSGDDGQHFIYLEGFENDQAMKEHNAMPYKAMHVKKMRAHIKSASAKQFVQREWQ